MNASLLPTSEGPGSARAAPNRPPGFADAFTSVVADDLTELRDGCAEVGDVRLHYVEAWSQPGAAAAMINYYRAAVRESPKGADTAPTLVIFGQPDRYLFAPARPTTVRAPVVHPADSIAGAGNDQKGEL